MRGSFRQIELRMAKDCFVVANILLSQFASLLIYPSPMGDAIQQLNAF